MQDPKDLFLHPTSDLGKDLFSTSVAELRRKVRISKKIFVFPYLEIRYMYKEVPHYCLTMLFNAMSP